MSSEEQYKERLRDLDTEYLEQYRDKCLDTVRLVNEVLKEKKKKK